MKDKKFISISSKSSPTIEDFTRLMSYAEDKFNANSQINPKSYYKIKSSLLEEESIRVIQSVCDNTIFKPSDIVLVSGSKFPDIQAHVHFGVEVKSTEGKTWTSTGSSIVESTRIRDIDYIYMLFGKLGSNPPEFRCRPYNSVLKDIAVTHSPRYTIDMELTQGNTIFDKMGIDYEDFRHDENKIDKVRNYYREKNKKNHKTATQWWLGKESPVNLEIMREGFNFERKKELIADMLILFSELIEGEYGEAAVWLCTRKFIINPSFRDLFSAGGRLIGIDDKTFKQSYPHIVGCILEHLPHIIRRLSIKDADLIEDIRTLWEIKRLPSNLFEAWVSRIEHIFAQNKDLSDIDIRKLINSRPEKIIYTGTVRNCSYI